MAMTRKNLRVCQVVHDETYYDVIVAVDNLDEVDNILQEWALDTLEETLNLPEELIYNKDITEVITSLDIDNFAYVASAVSKYMDMPAYAGISGVLPVFPTTLTAGLYVMPTCTAFLYSQALWTGYFGEYTIPEKSLALTAGIVNYIGIRFNAGVPEYIVYDDEDTFDYSSIIPVAKVLSFGGILYVLPYGQSGYGLPEKLLKIMKQRMEFDIITAFTLDTSTNYIELGALTVTNGTAEVDCLAVDTETAGNDMFLHYKDSNDDWQTSAVTQIDNLQYQSVSGLANLVGGEYVINYVYRLIDATAKMLFTVLSNKFATLAAAKESEIITDLPDMIKANAVLVGRIIVVQGGSSPVVQKVQKQNWGVVA